MTILSNAKDPATSLANGGREANAQWKDGKPSTLVFDVNETLIDFESMVPLFERVFDDKRVLREWLGQLIMYSMTVTLHPFSGWLSRWRVAAMAEPPLGVLRGNGLEPRLKGHLQGLARAGAHPA